MYKIAYLDDEEDIVRQFQISTSEIFDIPDIELEDDIDNILKMIKEDRYDALIIDYSLNDTKHNIHFNGINVINVILEELEEFPCFILTSYEETAEEGNLNPDMIYPKEEVFENPARFIRKVERKINNYHDKISHYQEEINSLLKLASSRPLTLSEEENLIKMDNFLEGVSSKKSAIPDSLKNTKNNELLRSLIDKTEMILKELNDNEK